MPTRSAEESTVPVTPRQRQAPGARSTQTRTIVLDGRDISYIWRPSARARYLRLLVRPTTGLEVVVPRGTSKARVEEVLREKARWVLATLERVAREDAISTPPPLSAGKLLPYAGAQLRLAIRTGAPTGRFRAELDGTVLTLTVSEPTQEVLHAALEAWYRRRAHVVFAERLAVCNTHYGFRYGRVSIKEQKSRWGSCSRQGNLNFNWRLLLAPLPVLDYVVIHELAHLKELNHSPRFWQLVAAACPEYLAHRRWLRQHGRELRF